MQRIDLSTFREDDTFYNEIELICTVKSFDLQAIRKRYIASRKKSTGKVGSVERRKVSTGGITKLKIREGKIIEEEILVRMKEPRGIAAGAVFGVAAENKVYVISGGRLKTIEDPWFSYIHTLDFHPDDPNRVLVSSSGYDCIFEYDAKSGEKRYEWFAWENGFNVAHDEKAGDMLLTRNKEEAEAYAKQQLNHIFIADPLKDTLPTAKRAAFINSVCYDRNHPGQLLATFFHEGKVYGINQQNGNAVPLISGLKNPHGGRNYRKGYMATSTGDGLVFCLENGQLTEYDFRSLKGKPEELSGLEWLQNSIVPHNSGVIMTIDSNRNCFVLFHPEKKVVSMVPYDQDWAIQDFVDDGLSKENEEVVRSLG